MVVPKALEPAMAAEVALLLEQVHALPLTDPKVLELSLQLKHWAEQHQDRAALAQGLVWAAKHCHGTLEYQKTKVYLGELLSKDLVPTLHPSQQAEARLLLAETYNLLGENEQSLEQVLKALELSREQRNLHGEASCLNVMAYIYDDTGLFQEALEYALSSLEVLKGASPKPELLGLVYNNVGNIYNHLGDNKQALEFYSRSLAYLEQSHHLSHTSSTLYKGSVLNNIGLIYADAEEFEVAITYYTNAIATSASVQDSYMLIIEYSNQGRAQSCLGDYASSLESFQQALDYLKRHPSLDLEAMVYVNMGESYIKQQLYDVAESYLRQGLQAAEAAKSMRRIVRAHEHLCELYEHTGNLSQALLHHKRFHTIKVDSLEQSASARTKAMMTKFKVERLEQEQELYRVKNVELAAAVRQLEQLSHQDGLTGLYNRRFFDMRLKHVLESAKQKEESVCIALADIDNFKRVNDTFSHAIGDEVLKIVAGIFMNTLRGADVVARYGGEEIVIIFPETLVGNAKLVCEKIRQKIERYPWHHLREDLKITVSMGLVGGLETTPEQLLALADERLYKAKRSGKNKIEL